MSIPANDAQLDMILQTRLDVLAQAVEEVNGVIDAMAEQGKRLAEVEAFLTSDAGTLYNAESDIIESITDAATRLRVVLRGQSSRRPPVLRSVDPASPASPASPATRDESDERQRLRDGLKLANTALAQAEGIAEKRENAYASFLSVRRWSVAELGDVALKAAVRDYEQMINEIRVAENPWRRYRAEMPRRGHELFRRYLELLAGMAVRGFGLEPAIMSDVEALLQQLMEPLHLPAKPSKRERSPLAMMSSLGRGHLPLGYPEWSLWALPLLGRSVGELVVPALMQDVNSRQVMLCADVYAQYVLGPGYLHAAIFLDFDPSSDPSSPEVPSDALRASVLFEAFPRLSDTEDQDTSKQVDAVVDRVKEQWLRARQAVGGDEEILAAEDREMIDRFLTELSTRFPEIGYPADRIADNRDVGRDLMKSSDQSGSPEGMGSAEWVPSAPAMQLRDLMSAMWLARLEDPTKARLIHARAKAVARQGPGPSPKRPHAAAQPRSE